MEVANLEREATRLTEELDGLLVAVRPDLADQARTWIKQKVAATIEAKPQQVQGLGMDRLKELKAGVAEVIEGLPAVVERLTKHENMWPHRRTDRESSQARDSYFSEVYRRAVSTLGPVLKEYGLVELGQHAEWKVEHGGLRYAYGIDLAGKRVPSLATYEEKLREFRDLATKLKVKREQFAKAQAREMWESA